MNKTEVMSEVKTSVSLTEQLYGLYSMKAKILGSLVSWRLKQSLTFILVVASMLSCLMVPLIINRVLGGEPKGWQWVPSMLVMVSFMALMVFVLFKGMFYLDNVWVDKPLQVADYNSINDGLLSAKEKIDLCLLIESKLVWGCCSSVSKIKQEITRLQPQGAPNELIALKQKLGYVGG